MDSAECNSHLFFYFGFYLQDPQVEPISATELAFCGSPPEQWLIKALKFLNFSTAPGALIRFIPFA
jgi:hypothetical protein